MQRDGRVSRPLPQPLPEAGRGLIYREALHILVRIRPLPNPSPKRGGALSIVDHHSSSFELAPSISPPRFGEGRGRGYPILNLPSPLRGGAGEGLSDPQSPLPASGRGGGGVMRPHRPLPQRRSAFSFGS